MKINRKFWNFPVLTMQLNYDNFFKRTTKPDIFVSGFVTLINIVYIPIDVTTFALPTWIVCDDCELSGAVLMI